MECINQPTMMSSCTTCTEVCSSGEACVLETSIALCCQGRDKEALHLLEASELKINAPDLYLEEEGDVGPRAFRMPSFSNQCQEAAVIYNRALIHQARNEFDDAVRLYETIAQAPISRVPGLDFVVLKMRAYNNVGQIIYMEGISKAKALDMFSMALQIAQTLDSQYSLDLATVLSNWCRVQFMSGDVNQAVYEGLHEILRIRLAVLARDHTDVASAHFNLGVTEYAHNDGQKAVGHLMKYLQVVAAQASKNNRSSPADMSLDPIPALIYILLIKNEDKEDSLAQELVRGLRTLQEKRADSVMGQQPHAIAPVLNFIGTLLFHQRDFDHALLFFQEELRLEESCVAKCCNDTVEDISVRVTCNNIARILQELQRLPEAKYYYYRSLVVDYGADIQSRYLSSKKDMDSPHSDHVAPLQSGREVSELPASTINLYSTVWYNLGLIHDKQGACKASIHAFQMSLSLRRVMLGPDHADVACLSYNIGVLQMEQQFLKEATRSLKEALRIRRAAPSSSAPSGQLNDGHVVKTLQKLASLHKAKGDIHGALEAQTHIFHIQGCSIEYGSTNMRHKDMSATSREMAELYHARSDLDLAVQKANEAVVLMRQTLVDTSSGDMTEFVANKEEMVAALLLLGSLKHEVILPEEARDHYQEASALIREAANCFSHPTQLNALFEVATMLATSFCAPEA